MSADPQQSVGLPPPRTELMVSRPGVARDGTRLNRQQYIDAQWCRWYQHLPRKMGGYREQVRNSPAIVRAIDVFSSDAITHVHLGHQNGINKYTINNITGTNSALVTRTPAGITPDPKYSWQFAQAFNTADGTTDLIAAQTDNAQFLSSSAEYPVYHGDILATTPLATIPDTLSGVPPGTNITSSGGCCSIGGFTFVYGHDGHIRWSKPYSLDFGDVTNGAGDSRPVSDKVVLGMPLRGQTAPSGLWWSLSSVIVGSFTGSVNVWDFTTLTTTSAILSPAGVVEHNGIYYWPTTAGFAMFNGVVRDLPNDTNRQWFLDNINWPQRIKVFGFKVPRWNEIWWCFPLGTATECNWAVIYNYVENAWYDTPLPNGGRSAAKYEFIYNFPLVGGVLKNVDTNGYSVWQHEFGKDEISGPAGTTIAIKSSYQTNEFSVVEPQQMGQVGVDQSINYSLLEPDFDQVGDLMFTVISRANARAAEVVSDVMTINQVPNPGEQLVKFAHTGRLTSFKLESNTVGGDYTTGSPIIHFQPGDGRRED